MFDICYTHFPTTGLFFHGPLSQLIIIRILNFDQISWILSIAIWRYHTFPQVGKVIQMPVPSSYNDITTSREIRDHVGAVWYQRLFFVPSTWQEQRVFVRFGSVNYLAQVVSVPNIRLVAMSTTEQGSLEATVFAEDVRIKLVRRFLDKERGDSHGHPQLESFKTCTVYRPVTGYRVI